MDVIVLNFMGVPQKTPRSELVNESMGVRDSRRYWIGYPQSATGTSRAL
jgi:hypothetical protein